MLPTTHSFHNIDFKGGNLTSNGGFILILTFLMKTNLLSYLQKIPFIDHKCDTKTTFKNVDIVLQKIIFNFLGLWKSKDRSSLSRDPLFKGMKICSRATESRLYKRITEKTIEYLSDLIMEISCRYVATTQTTVILDQDSTLVETSGCQMYSAFVHHYMKMGYHPLLVTEQNTKFILHAWLRPGSASAAGGAEEQITKVINCLLKYNPNLIIKSRMDAASYDGDLIDVLEDKCVCFYIRAKNYQCITEAAWSAAAHDGVDFCNHTILNPYYGEFRYQIGSRKEPYRIVYKLYRAYDKKTGQLELFPTVYGVITSDEAQTPHQIMNLYEGRGESELINKYLKDDFYAGNLSHSEMKDNAFDFLLCALCYDLFILFKWYVLEGKDKRMRMNTFRYWYGKTAAKITKHSRQARLSFSTSTPNQEKLSKYIAKVDNLGPIILLR